MQSADFLSTGYLCSHKYFRLVMPFCVIGILNVFLMHEIYSKCTVSHQYIHMINVRVAFPRIVMLTIFKNVTLQV